MTTPAQPDAPGAQPPATEPPAPSPAPPAPEPAAPQPPASSEPQAPGADELPPWAQRELKKLRDEAAGNRVKAKEATDAAAAELARLRKEQEDQRIAMGKALGLVADEPPTAEQLAKQLADSNAATQAAADRARQAAVELAVLRAASRQQADGDALLDSRQFTSSIAALDPAAADFAQQVNAAITAAVEAQPKYKIAPAAPPPRPEPTVPKSGPGQFSGAPQDPRQWTQEDVDRATPQELDEAIDKGYLQALGVGKRRRAAWGRR